METEQRGLDEFGYNDVFIELADVEFRFCNDMDIHIAFNYHHAFIDDFYTRWENMGYSPAEWFKDQKSGLGNCARGRKPDV